MITDNVAAMITDNVADSLLMFSTLALISESWSMVLFSASSDGQILDDKLYLYTSSLKKTMPTNWYPQKYGHEAWSNTFSFGVVFWYFNYCSESSETKDILWAGQRVLSPPGHLCFNHIVIVVYMKSAILHPNLPLTFTCTGFCIERTPIC